MPAGDIWQVVFRSGLVDQLGLNVRHYRTNSETGTGATAVEIATAISPTFAPLYKALLTNNANFLGVTAQKIRPVPVGMRGGFGGDTGAGTAGTDPLPRQVSGIIRHVTPFAGPGFRGRSYIPFPDENDNTADGAPTAGYITRLAALATEMSDQEVIVGAGGTTTIDPVVFRRESNTFSFIVDPSTALGRWATQRRRGAFGRLNPVTVVTTGIG